jgi:hypothetical protein
MIMGMDLMTSIGITVDCEQRCIRLGVTEIPLKNRTTLDMTGRHKTLRLGIFNPEI